MGEHGQVEFEIKLSIDETTSEELDETTRRLFNEVRELNVESIELTKGEVAPEGSKGDPITLGSITVAVLPAAIPSLIALLQAWTQRGQGRTVKFKGKIGREVIEFEGPPDEFQKLIHSLDKGK